MEEYINLVLEKYHLSRTIDWKARHPGERAMAGSGFEWFVRSKQSYFYDCSL